MSKQIGDVVIFQEGETSPNAFYQPALDNGGHVAFNLDGTWIATYFPKGTGSDLSPARWNSLEEFYQWIGWARF